MNFHTLCVWDDRACVCVCDCGQLTTQGTCKSLCKCHCRVCYCCCVCVCVQLIGRCGVLVVCVRVFSHLLSWICVHIHTHVVHTSGPPAQRFSFATLCNCDCGWWWLAGWMCVSPTVCIFLNPCHTMVFNVSVLCRPYSVCFILGTFRHPTSAVHCTRIMNGTNRIIHSIVYASNVKGVCGNCWLLMLFPRLSGIAFAKCY